LIRNLDLKIIEKKLENEDRFETSTPMRYDLFAIPVAPESVCGISRRRRSFVRKVLWNFHINSLDRETWRESAI